MVRIVAFAKLTLTVAKLHGGDLPALAEESLPLAAFGATKAPQEEIVVISHWHQKANLG